jgi:hypothetical protein
MNGTGWTGRLVVGLILLLVWLLTSGCRSVVCGVGRLHGYRGPCHMGGCAPESVKAGYCIPMTEKGKQS